ncbi:GNAT family N-acetyltransferase [Phyllobacterium salinisoli]|uniref:GNAT family N-acetyltransferase n=1 Tax=Phyllobacterium salinisoli TaxID=1899321 RepID=A0A368K6H3_9HYPH|nr:GNAT family N-acetyltransferase [Phyllobacterium salinisoli]RCS24831.1 GNAT family N-acetyltransferase [Phyllobacterium salinisoli]
MINIEALGLHPELIALCARWNYEEWGKHDGRSLEETIAGLQQIIAGAKQEALVALWGTVPCGMVLLIDCDLASHSHLTPWVASVLVHREFRGRGVGRELLAAIERSAHGFGFDGAHLYTAMPDYYRRSGWLDRESLTQGEDELFIMSKFLG